MPRRMARREVRSPQNDLQRARLSLELERLAKVRSDLQRLHRECELHGGEKAPKWLVVALAAVQTGYCEALERVPQHAPSALWRARADADLLASVLARDYGAEDED